MRGSQWRGGGEAGSPEGTNLLLLCCRSMMTSIVAMEQLDRVRVTGTTQRLEREERSHDLRWQEMLQI